MTEMKQKITLLNDMPLEKLPEFWNDSARINALYAPFRDRSVNPRDWDSKLNFWKGIIGTWCDYNRICTFNEIQLKQSFVQNGRTPASINVIVNEMFKNGEIVTLDQYLCSPKQSWTGWAFDLTIRKPLSWTFNKVKNVFIPPITIDTVFIHVESVKKQSEKLFKDLPEEYRNKVISIDKLMELCNVKDVNTDTIHLLLHKLKLDGKVDTADFKFENKDSVLLIKFACSNEKVEPISTIDIGKYKLQQNEEVLVQRIEELEKEKNLAMDNTKMYLKKGMKNMAKNWLRKEHELGKRIDGQYKILENVQTLLVKIGTAESDGHVFQSYKFGLDALKAVFKETGLSEDGVIDTMLDLEGVLDTHDDIQASLSKTLNSTLDAELEDELAELLAEPNEEHPPEPPTDNTPPKKQPDVNDVEDDLLKRLNALKMPTPPEQTPTNSPDQSFAALF